MNLIKFVKELNMSKPISNPILFYFLIDVTHLRNVWHEKNNPYRG